MPSARLDFPVTETAVGEWRLGGRQVRCFGDAAGCGGRGCSLCIYGGSQLGQQSPVLAPLLFLHTMWCQQCSASWYGQQVPPKYQVALGRQEEIMFVVTQGPVPPFHRALAFVICLLFLNQRVPPFSLWFFEDSKIPLLFSVLKKGHVWKINSHRLMRGIWTDLKRLQCFW